VQTKKHITPVYISPLSRKDRVTNEAVPLLFITMKQLFDSIMMSLRPEPFNKEWKHKQDLCHLDMYNEWITSTYSV